MDPEAESFSSPSLELLPPEPAPSGFRAIFIGPNGIRAGWRLLMFLGIFFVITLAIQRVLRFFPALVALVRAQGTGLLNPLGVIVGEGSVALGLLLSTLVMTMIERRSFADYGLPSREAFGKRFCQGAAWGLGTVTLMMGLIAAFGGFSLGTLAARGTDIFKYALLWALAFLVVGFFEEFSFRGYLQSTLGSGIGFWPAALILSIVFGAIHLGNKGEAWVGALGAGSFGLLATFTLRRTGSIWFAIGEHMAFDWGETFLYSVPDSGLLARGKLLNSSIHGPRWLSGGSIGPEGSVMAFVTLLIVAALFNYFYPAKKTS